MRDNQAAMRTTATEKRNIAQRVAANRHRIRNVLHNV
jgi:hypothetical protein